MSEHMYKVKRIARAVMYLMISVSLLSMLITAEQFALTPIVEYLRQYARNEAAAFFMVLAYVFVYLEAAEEEKHGHNYRAFMYGFTAVAMALAALLL